MTDTKAIDIGSRRELFIDDFMIGALTAGARRVMHAPQPREVAIVHDRSWEGNSCGYCTLFHDQDGIRAYYRGSQHNARIGGGSNMHQFACLAQSDDGIHWRKPALNVIEFQGSKRNNIVYTGVARGNFAPFKDTRPGCPEAERYKALGGKSKGLIPYCSPDGIHWRAAADQPVITDGIFDSQNLAFWDDVRGEYRAYYRDYKGRDPNYIPKRGGGAKGGGPQGVRDIKTATSPDFLNWSQGQWLEYPGAPVEELYTNQICLYPRAPHIFVGFPTRFLPDRGQIVEGLLMAGRDGQTFQRWGEALIRPGLIRERWANRSNYIWNGLIETPSDLPGAPNEWSLYSTEGYLEGAHCRTRRFTIRLDGFVSVNAPLSGGELLTPIIRFEGSRLLLNVATSAAGSVRVEIQHPDGRPIEGFNASDSETVWGDTIEHAVSWNDTPDIARLSGQPVRLRFVMADADLYSFRFGEES